MANTAARGSSGAGAPGDGTELLGEPIPPTPRRMVKAPEDAAARRLDAVEHIVVLMLSGRSFDHMLGHLSLPGAIGGGERRDVDGLQEAQTARSWHLEETALATELDGPSGSISRHHAPTDPADPVFGFYDGDDLPIYDHLASQFCVVDRWFSSVPDGGWSNRVCAIAGREPPAADPSSACFCSLPSFPRYLDEAGVTWRWYSYLPGTLRAIDPRYRLGEHDRFSFVESRKLSAREPLRLEPSFIDDAARGRLAAVSWIDPCFADLSVLGPSSNDDGPPSDVLAGQDLVLMVYNALCSTSTWARTLLIVTYDHDGGFFDHVPPPAAPDSELDRPLGARVPALLISPLVAAGVSSTALLGEHMHFEHASIAKTILTRFCGDGSEIPAMSARVAAANHLGHLLSGERPREEIADRTELAALMATWRQQWIAARYRASHTEPALPLTELQRAMLGMTRRLRRAGLPAGHP